MNDIIIRHHGHGYVVAEPVPRMRRDEPAIGTKRARWYSTRTGALSAAMDRLHADTEPSREVAQNATATPRRPSYDDLKPQARRVIKLMCLHGRVTALMAMREGIGRLSARIYEIRAVFGEDSVETVRPKGVTYAEYHWRGPDSVQLEAA